MPDIIKSSRRKFIQGLGLMLAAPAILRVVKPMRLAPQPVFGFDLGGQDWTVIAWVKPNGLLAINKITLEPAEITLERDLNVLIQPFPAINPTGAL